MKLPVFIIVNFLLLLSCSSDQSSNWDVNRFKGFSTEIGEIFPNRTPEIIYFIPVGGCHACVLESIKFSKEHINNMSILFVLVSQTGRKSITVHYSEEELNAPNLMVDGSGIAYQGGVIENTITIYYLSENNKYKRVDVQPSSFEDELKHVDELLR
jgi:hypothetical protein